MWPPADLRAPGAAELASAAARGAPPVHAEGGGALDGSELRSPALPVSGLLLPALGGCAEGAAAGSVAR
eukprot:7194503-Pyramimonas_sp.AAC.1